MSKKIKSAVATVSPVVAALILAMESMKTLPAAPAFNGDAIREALTASALPADFITKAVAESQRKHEAAHGDTQGKELAALFDSLLNIEGMEPETLVRAVKSAAGIVRKPRVELTDAQKEEVKEERRKGAQPSALALKYNVSEGTIAALVAGIKPATATPASV